jgi:hypothetical protein
VGVGRGRGMVQGWGKVEVGGMAMDAGTPSPFPFSVRFL